MNETAPPPEPQPVRTPRRRGILRAVGVSLILLLLATAATLRHQILARWHFSAATAAVAAVQLEYAKQSLRVGLTQDPDHLPSVLLLSRILQLEGRLNEALRLLRFAEQLSDSDAAVRHERQLIHARLGGYVADDSAVRRLLEQTDDDPRGVYDAFVAGYCTYHQFDDALRLLNEWRRLWPDDFRVSAYRGDIDRTRGQWAVASEHYRQAIAEGDLRLQTQLSLAECCVAAGNLDEADQILNVCVRESAECSRGWDLLARVNLQRRRLDVAEDAVRHSLATGSPSSATLLLQSQILLENSECEEAVSVLESLLVHWPQDVAALQQYEQALSELGRDREATATRQRLRTATEACEAIDVLTEQLSGDRGNTELHLQLGALQMEHISRESAIPHLAMVLRKAPQQRLAHELMQRYYSFANRTDMATMHLLASESLRRFHITDE